MQSDFCIDLEGEILDIALHVQHLETFRFRSSVLLVHSSSVPFERYSVQREPFKIFISVEGLIMTLLLPSDYWDSCDTKCTLANTNLVHLCKEYSMAIKTFAYVLASCNLMYSLYSQIIFICAFAQSKTQVYLLFTHENKFYETKLNKTSAPRTLRKITKRCWRGIVSRLSNSLEKNKIYAFPAQKLSRIMAHSGPWRGEKKSKPLKPLK